MRLVFLVLALLQTGPSVRFEKDGVRVGDKLVVGTEEELTDLAKVPVRVSNHSVRNLSAKGQTIDAILNSGGQQITLGPSTGIQRDDKRYSLTAERGKLEISAGDKKLEVKSSAATFTLTANGFDFGKLGLLEGNSLSVSSTAVKK